MFWGSRRLSWNERKWIRSASICALKPLSKTHFRPASRSEDTRRILDSRSEVGNFKRAPVYGALFPKPRLGVRNEGEKYNGSS
jgi:hypothetical protein